MSTLAHARVRARLAVAIAVTVGASAMLVPATASAAPEPGEVTVMTRNIYLGADLSGALEAESGSELAIQAGIILQAVRETNFPVRARMLAAEIKDAKPDLVGLQEVALWRRDTTPNPNSGGPNPYSDGPQTAGTTVDYNFLGVLMRKLHNAGADYRVVRVQREADIEAPANGACPEIDTGEPEGLCDGRLTMRDVILAREGAGVRTRFDDSARFENNLVFENIAGTSLDVTVFRGWTRTDANVRGTRFRFVNTHLEAFDYDIREAQARELVASLGAAPEPGPADIPSAGETPIVLLGDFNTDDEIVETLGDSEQHQQDEEPYAVLTAEGYVERSPDVPGLAGDEYACCYRLDQPLPDDINPLDNENQTFDHTVDHVMVSDPAITDERSFVTGDDASLRLRDLWPSDHGGVVTRLQFPTGP